MCSSDLRRGRTSSTKHEYIMRLSGKHGDRTITYLSINTKQTHFASTHLNNRINTLPTCAAPSSSGQDSGLSSRKHGFDSRWGHHSVLAMLGFMMR